MTEECLVCQRITTHPVARVQEWPICSKACVTEWKQLSQPEKEHYLITANYVHNECCA